MSPPNFAASYAGEPVNVTHDRDLVYLDGWRLGRAYRRTQGRRP